MVAGLGAVTRTPLAVVQRFGAEKVLAVILDLNNKNNETLKLAYLYRYKTVHAHRDILLVHMLSLHSWKVDDVWDACQRFDSTRVRVRDTTRVSVWLDRY